MSELRYPNETQDYGKARDELLAEERALVDKVRSEFLEQHFLND